MLSGIKYPRQPHQTSCILEHLGCTQPHPKPPRSGLVSHPIGCPLSHSNRNRRVRETITNKPTTFPKAKRSSASSLFSRLYVVSGRTGLLTRKDRIRRAVAFVKASHATFLFSIPRRRTKAENAVPNPYAPTACSISGSSICREPPKKNTRTQPKSHLTSCHRRASF